MTKSNDTAELAGERTDLAEDRTVLANERTFAGWMRTGLAAVGIGLGFNALFGKMEPSWLPKAIASCFILSGMVIFYLAERNSCSVLERLDAHSVQPLKRMNLRLGASLMGTGSVVLCSDGLSRSFVSDDLRNEEPIDAMADRLLRNALERDGRDNISFVLVKA